MRKLRVTSVLAIAVLLALAVVIITQIHQPSNAAQRKLSIPTDTVAQQARPSMGNQLRGVQHIGVTVHDMAKSYEFYSEMLGGTLILRDTGLDGNTIQNTLMQKEELDAKALGVDPTAIGVPNMRDNKAKLDVRFIQLDNVVIELLQYRAPDQKPGGVGSFAPFPQFTSPAFPNSMHISFQVADDINFDEFIRNLEQAATARGITNVRCNRTVRVGIDSERMQVPLTAYTNKIRGSRAGDSDGWTLAYCKGPDGEQLEFNQVLLRAKTVFDRARQQRQRLTGSRASA